MPIPVPLRSMARVAHKYRNVKCKIEVARTARILKILRFTQNDMPFSAILRSEATKDLKII